jgi:hypothetical protein
MIRKQLLGMVFPLKKTPECLRRTAMNTTQEQANMSSQNFVANEYKSIVTTRKLASIYADYYPQFGWKLENSTFASQSNRVSMTFKRDRHLKNKMEINNNQRQFEKGVDTITHLEKSKTTRASIVAYTVGLLGSAFMAGAVFAYLAANIVLCIILAIPAFAGWGLTYILYKNLVKKHSDEIIPKIDREFDTMYSACERANALLVG